MGDSGAGFNRNFLGGISGRYTGYSIFIQGLSGYTGLGIGKLFLYGRIFLPVLDGEEGKRKICLRQTDMDYCRCGSFCGGR